MLKAQKRITHMNFRLIFFGLMALALPFAAVAAESGGEAAGGHGGEVGITLLFLGVLLLAAKLGGIVEKFGQPGVLGEIGAGIALSAVAFFGLQAITDIRHNEVLAFIAELGAVILLFQIGLESNIGKMMKVGLNALLVAVIGVVAPFVLGAFVLGPLLLPHLDFVSHLFLGAALVATSVGITAYVFREMGIAKTRASQTVLGAAVIDDILGLLVLAIVSALAAGGSVDGPFIMLLTVKAFGFLAGALILGNILAKVLSRAFSAIHTGTGMKLALALSFALSYAYIATLVGLAPIVGAFAAGLILDAVHFNSFDLPPIAKQLKRLRGFDKKEKKKIDELIEEHKHGHVEDLVGNLGLLLVPIFFVYTGLQIEFSSLLDPSLYVTAGIISVVAIFGKVIAGFAARGKLQEKLLVGVSMVPRGEVGLIFASVGKGLGAINDELFSIIILVIIITTFIAPPLIKLLSRRMERAQNIPMKPAHGRS
jgi:Kef-type K+ transport system membrane component KefB